MTYLLRVNLDIEDKDPTGSQRFKTAVSTINYILKGGHKVVILSHFDRPSKYDRRLSLSRFQPFLQKKLGKTVVFFPQFDFPKIRRSILTSENHVFLLDNLRFLLGETKNDPATASQLASLGDRYINDDFATAHREAASTVAITKLMPSSPGPTLLSEVAHLTKVTVHPRKPVTLIIGGEKMKDKIGVVHHMLNKIDHVLIGGGPANTFLLAEGKNIKKSICEPDMLAEVKKLMKNKKIVTPMDSRWGSDKILDIGPKTAKEFSSIIRKSATVIWGGPMGYFENPHFAKGSYDIARALAASHSFSVVGGEETGMVINHLKLNNKISFLSTGGGAMLDLLAGERMPGLNALKIRY
ncbi:MAG: phosphoglycerate kinase [Patescibacteria group bacterium]|nr:phosphoglycerate kinase [Patescibacteria group bacterium]MCL5224032.1 phosphoglycerate kinase [Patescibacteria group bacterium]